MRIRLLFVLALLAAWPAHAQVGKWVDKQGKVHYGDQPPQVPVKEVPLANGTVSLADEGPFHAAPAQWASRSAANVGSAAAGGSSAAPVSRASGYRRCGR